jgi:cell division septum initiation protein DivIVA
MDPEVLRTEAKRLRSAETSGGLRGFDEGETRRLLEATAGLLETAAGEHEAVQRELERLRSEADDEVAGKEAIGKALVAAARAGEEIAAEARVSAERITTEAETHAAAILEQATAAADERERERIAAQEGLEKEKAAARLELELERTRVLGEAREQAATILAGARREVEQLQRYGERLRSLLADSKRRFVELAESGLRQLDGVEAEQISRHGDLLDELRPTRAERSASAVRGD